MDTIQISDRAVEAMAMQNGTGIKVMFDSGTFAHLFAEDLAPYVRNIRTVKPIKVNGATDAGILSQMGDLRTGEHDIGSGYLNQNL